MQSMILGESSVLVVEDEPILLEMTSHWLECEGARVLAAENGMVALEKIASGPVDLIITDIRMPQLDGLSLLKKLKSRGTSVPSILVIGSASKVSIRDACDLGVEATFKKPVIRQELTRAAERILIEKETVWRSPWLGEMVPVLSAIFGSLDSALRAGQIAFGRGGFCIESGGSWQEGPVRLAIDFAADGRSLSGHGFIRWLAPQERRVGVEIAQLDDAALDWALHQTRQNATASFIPRDATAVQEYGSGLSGDASHELRNLLTVVIAYSEACKQILKPEDPVSYYVEQMRLCTERAASLIRQTKD
jgi:CheY-like chemotaxis protein